MPPRPAATCRSAALGSGSDYTAFLQHLGIASLNLGFGGEDESGRQLPLGLRQLTITSRTSTIPGLAYGAALSKVVGRLVLRAADAPRVPARYSRLRRAPSSRYLDDVKKLAADQREKDRTLADLRREGDFTLAASPHDPTVAPADQGVTPLIDMLPLENAVDHLKRAAAAADAMLGREDKPAAGDPGADQRQPRQHRPAAARPAGPARPPVVQEPGLRARHAHRLRRQDPARRARGRSSSAASTTPAPMSCAPPRCSRIMPTASTRRRRWRGRRHEPLDWPR